LVAVVLVILEIKAPAVAVIPHFVEVLIAAG
jgi:hypothetical protein